MNLQQLYYFRKLAEVQHYTEAAKALYITQPSLSDSISSLESELSVALFQKKGRGIELTKYGQEFYQYVNQALGILEHGIAIMKEKSDLVTGTIDVGCIPTLLGDFLPDALDLYHEKHPQVSFNIFHEKSIPVAEGVSTGNYDIGFCSMVENKPDLVFVPITFQELIVIVRNDHPLASHDSIQLSDLQDYTLSTYRDTIPIGKVVRKLFLAAHARKHHQHARQAGREADGPGRNAAAGRLRLQHRLGLRAQGSQRAAAHRLHHDARQAVFLQYFVLLPGALHGPVQIIQLQLGKIPRVGGAYRAQHGGLVVEREAQAAAFFRARNSNAPMRRIFSNRSASTAWHR